MLDRRMRRTLRSASVLTLMVSFCGAGPALAQAVDADQTDAPPPEEDSEAIVVTARFRQESAQKVGASISAIDGRAIEREGIRDFSDIARRTPGVTTIDRGPSQNDVSIRGISNGVSLRLSDLGGSGPLVSQFLDDVPVAAATASQRDFNYFDFDRIEILRGPQPTLFGEGSVGGTIRYFSRDPQLSGGAVSDVRFLSSLSSTEQGGANVSASAATSFVLVPDKLGIRLVGNYRDDDGFIDNPLLGQKNINDHRAYSGRGVLLWQPVSDFSVRLMAFAGRDDFGGTYEVDPPTAPRDALKLSTPVDGDFYDEFQLYTGRITYDAGPVTLTSITSWYARDRQDEFFDAQSAAAFGRFTTALTATALSMSRDRSFTQELRFVSDLDGPLNVTAGLYYKKASYFSTLSTTAPEFAPYTYPVGGTTLIGQSGSSVSRQYSGFVELTLAASDRLRLIAGVRYVNQKITSTSIESVAAFGGGALGLSPPFVIADVNAIATAYGIPLSESFKLSKFLPRGSIEYDLGKNAMLYGIVSTGLRGGNLNPFTSALRGAGSPPDSAKFEAARSFHQDQVLTEEIGLKTNWFQGALTVNLASFHTHFDDPQIVTSNPFVLTVNGPDIEIWGIELQSSWRVRRGLNVYLNGTWQDARFLHDAVLANPAVLAALGVSADLKKGARPVNTPEWAVTAGLDFRQPIAPDVSITGLLAYQYVGDRYSTSQNFPSSRLGSQNIVNARLGIQFPNWSITGFVDNLTNDIEYQSIQGNAGTPVLVNGRLDFVPTSVSVNRPRTIGLEFGASF